MTNYQSCRTWMKTKLICVFMIAIFEYSIGSKASAFMLEGGSGVKLCVDASPSRVSKVKSDVADYFYNRLTPQKIVEEYKYDSVGYAALIYLVYFREKNSIKILEEEGWNNVKSSLDRNLNYVALESILRNKTYFIYFKKYDDLGFLKCISDNDDPLINSIRVIVYDLFNGESMKILQGIDVIRYASRISAKFLDLYMQKMEILQDDGRDDLIGEEIDYWYQKARICNVYVGVGLGECIDQIRNYVIMNFDKIRKTSNLHLACNVGIVDSEIAFHFNFCN